MLPSHWIDSLFARLQVRYGAAWTRMWEGINLDAVKDDWATELAGFVSRPEALQHGLNHLPTDFPPNVKQFSALCRNAPGKPFVALPRPAVSDAEKQKAREIVEVVAKSGAKPDPEDWARRLRAREAAGERLNETQKRCWRAALGAEHALA